MTAQLPQEVTISVKAATVTEWAMHIGDPFESPLPPVMLFLAEDVHEALRQGQALWPGRGTTEVTQSGYARCDYAHGTAVYELFPAKFDDNRPYNPAVYVGRWPD